MKKPAMIPGLALLALATMHLQAEMRIAPPDAMKAVATKVPPDYPPIAKQMRITGHVEIEVSITTDGSVENSKVVMGNALLTAAATTAVKKWKFTPFTDKGEAVKVVTVISFDFKL